MKGTEKQIAWAEELKANAIAALEWMRENPSDPGKENIELWNQGIDFQINRINSVEYAGKLIDVLRFVNFNNTPDQVGMAVVSQTNRYLKYEEERTMEKNELIQRLEKAPGKTFVEDGYFYSYALIKRVTGEETTAIVRKLVGAKYRKYEVLYYTPEIKL